MNNTITICGNLTRDPELRHTASGVATATFSVAVNRRVVGKNDVVTESVSFFNVTTWQGLAENAMESLTKGCRVVVTGRLDQRSWDVEGDNGGRRTSYELVADDLGPSLRFQTARLNRVQRVQPQVATPFEVGAEAGNLVGAIVGPGPELGSEPF